MTHYVTRVELRNATAVQYAQLHEGMAKAGFKRTITGGNGDTYHLPTAEYSMLSNDLKLEEVRDLAKAVASAISASPLILVTSGASTWSLVKESPAV